ncbi:hypothetical protein FDUTEX481_07049 [Tolypothrix sp. PCC 7601]|nr:hypothetical protein FDUTEX481_07049 [Tolypothrix sp. PCC 7601]
MIINVSIFPLSLSGLRSLRFYTTYSTGSAVAIANSCILAALQL